MVYRDGGAPKGEVPGGGPSKAVDEDSGREGIGLKIGGLGVSAVPDRRGWGGIALNRECEVAVGGRPCCPVDSVCTVGDVGARGEPTVA